MIAFLAFALPLGLYLRWPSCLWNADGVACAAALELGNPVYLFHADHLIYAFLGFIVWKYILFPVGVARALPALQILTPLFSCIGLVALYKILQDIFEGRRWLALLMSVGAGTTAIFWVWSVEAQVYTLGFAALAWATKVLVFEKGSGRYGRAGLWYSIAVLGHLMNALWIFPAGYWLLRETGIPPVERRRNAGQFLAIAIAVVSAAYALVFIFVLHPAHLTPTMLSNWIKGSAGLTPDRHWGWHSAGWTAPLLWAHSTICYFWGSFWPYGGTPLPRWIWALTAVSILEVLWLLALAFRSSSPWRVFCVIWIAAYGVFLWTWEPTTLCYRMSECAPWTLLLAAGLQTLRRSSLKMCAAASLGLGFAILTWTTRIEPMSRPSLNTQYVETIELAQRTSDRSFYLLDGGISWIYLLYFTGRTAWNVNTQPPERLAAEIKRRAPNAPVYLSTGVFEQKASAPWIVSHRWKPLPGLPWLEMQS